MTWTTTRSSSFLDIVVICIDALLLLVIIIEGTLPGKRQRLGDQVFLLQLPRDASRRSLRPM